jgi:tetratricopeptide (TPR) repeat protein
MSSCIALSYLAACVVIVTPAPVVLARGAQENPDVLYQQRDVLESATRAAAIWAERLAVDPHDFESAWKLARAQYWLGTNGLPEPERKAALERGITAADQAIAIAPARPDGHFWKAANMGALAESFGLRQGIRYRGAIRSALERVLAIDPAYLDGSADRALGRWYHKVPALFGGSQKTSEAHLRKALAFNPASAITNLFLAETLIALGRHQEARTALAAVLSAPHDPEWAPEDRRFKQRARALLSRLEP